jgi:hypothetical protein
MKHEKSFKKDVLWDRLLKLRFSEKKHGFWAYSALTPHFSMRLALLARWVFEEKLHSDLVQQPARASAETCRGTPDSYREMEGYIHHRQVQRRP